MKFRHAWYLSAILVAVASMGYTQTAYEQTIARYLTLQTVLSSEKLAPSNLAAVESYLIAAEHMLRGTDSLQTGWLERVYTEGDMTYYAWYYRPMTILHALYKRLVALREGGQISISDSAEVLVNEVLRMTARGSPDSSVFERVVRVYEALEFLDQDYEFLTADDDDFGKSYHDEIVEFRHSDGEMEKGRLVALYSARPNRRPMVEKWVYRYTLNGDEFHCRKILVFRYLLPRR